MFFTCRFRSPAGPLTQVPCATPKRHPRPSSNYAATSSLQAFVHSPSEPSVSFPCRRDVQVPGTFTTVSPRRATASCTHMTWVRRCLTRSTPRLDAIAFDAVASTRTRGFYHLHHVSSHGHWAQSSRCTLGQRVKLSFFVHLAQPLTEKTSTTCCSACL